MPYLKSLQKNQKGFIAIIALGIFALMAVFGIIAQAVANSTVKSVKNTKQYYEARDIADSVTEYLQWELSHKDPGFNKDLIEDNGGEECDFSAFKDFTDSDLSINNDGAELLGNIIEEIKENLDNEYGDLQITDTCEKLLTKKNENGGINPHLSHLDLLGKAVKIRNMKIQGTSTTSDKYNDCPGISGQCYVTPIMGTGDAAAETDIDCESMMMGGNSVSELDHPCNWNVLKHGSSATDRVTIPLFNQEDGDVFNLAHCGGSNNCKLLLRIRPSCKYKYDQIPSTDSTQGSAGIFNPNGDPCEGNRWELAEEDLTKAIVQWQITGQCEDLEDEDEIVECGMINKVDMGVESNQGESSLINAEVINNGLGETTWAILGEFSKAQSTGGFEDENDPIINNLFTMLKPKLTLFLSSKLKAADLDIIDTSQDDGVSIMPNPLYLEYQVLTSQPIASPKIKMEVEIDVDGTIFKKTLYKYEEKELIDFAVQS